jgi:predicted DNA-binding protein with PD1-like motif
VFSKKEGAILIVRLHPGEELLESLRSVIKEHGVTTAVLLSGIGMLIETELGYFQGSGKGYSIHRYNEPCELVSLSGNVSRQESGYNLHLHANLAQTNGGAVGGHLMKATVHLTNEIFLLETGIPVYRRQEDNGLFGLYLE